MKQNLLLQSAMFDITKDVRIDDLNWSFLTAAVMQGFDGASNTAATLNRCAEQNTRN